MIETINGIIVVVIGIIITIVLVIRSCNRCPNCKGKLIDDDYDENIGRIVWTCKKCGTKWILY